MPTPTPSILGSAEQINEQSEDRNDMESLSNSLIVSHGTLGPHMTRLTTQSTLPLLLLSNYALYVKDR